MAPVEIIEASDPITAMVQFQISPVYEMLVSLHTLAAARRHLEWISTAQAVLGADFMAELHAIYEPLNGGTLLFEFPVNYPNHSDVPGFFTYVRTMDSTSFLFYLVGRVVSRTDLMQLQSDREKLSSVLSKCCHSWAPEVMLDEILDDVSRFKVRLVNLWERYWESFFKDQIAALQPNWAHAIADKKRILARDGGKSLLELVTGKTDLPDPLPADQPVTEMVFIPIFYVSAQSYVFFGYGNETILFDSERTEARLSELNQNKDWALSVAKALGDSTRLNILRLIAGHEGHMHGKKIASILDLSPSAVSRQLAQLRDCGLVSEEAHDDQTVTYRLIKSTLTDLPAKILDYLYS